MRMRRKKHGEERIAACAELLIKDPAASVDPKTYFPTSAPLHLEIGCGKGAFAVGMAKKYPDVNFIAMERVSDVACLALEKAMAAKEDGRENLRFVIGDARNLAEFFPAHAFECIYLNFSDPWPKKGYAKRRLTYRGFLELYRALLVPGGLLITEMPVDAPVASLQGWDILRDRTYGKTRLVIRQLETDVA